MKAVSSMATRHVLADLAAAAVDAGLAPVELESLGGVDAAARVRAGEGFDLVFLAQGALDALAAEGHVDAASVTPLLRSDVAVAVRADSEEPAAAPTGAAFADAAGVREAIAAAGRIGYSTGPSGTALIDLIAQWDLSARVSDRLVQARPGIPVATLVASGEVDLGFQQLSELVGEPGIRVLGVMPADAAITTVFSGAVSAVATDPAAARAVVEFFASEAAAALKAQHSFGVPTR